MRRVILPLAMCMLTACGGNQRYAADCTWPPHETRQLRETDAADARHLSDDAQTAEDVAIRHADLGQARALHSVNPGPYRERRDACKAQLFAAISRQHGVAVDAVAGAVGRRRLWLDAVVMLAFGGIYLVVARRVARLMFRGALADSVVLATVTSLAAAGAFALIGVLAGDAWSMLFEGLRVGNGHMSYRVERVPWRQHPAELFAIGVVTFVLVAVVTWHEQRRRNPPFITRELAR
jgi:hypothetical protein